MTAFPLSLSNNKKCGSIFYFLPKIPPNVIHFGIKITSWICQKVAYLNLKKILKFQLWQHFLMYSCAGRFCSFQDLGGCRMTATIAPCWLRALGWAVDFFLNFKYLLSLHFLVVALVLRLVISYGSLWYVAQHTHTQGVEFLRKLSSPLNPSSVFSSSSVFWKRLYIYCKVKNAVLFFSL